MRYGAFLGSEFLQSRLPFIAVWRDVQGLTNWTEHRTAQGARRSAKRNKGSAYQFDPFVGRGNTWRKVQA